MPSRSVRSAASRLAARSSATRASSAPVRSAMVARNFAVWPRSSSSDTPARRSACSRIVSTSGWMRRCSRSCRVPKTLPITVDHSPLLSIRDVAVSSDTALFFDVRSHGIRDEPANRLSAPDTQPRTLGRRHIDTPGDAMRAGSHSARRLAAARPRCQTTSSASCIDFHRLPPLVRTSGRRPPPAAGIARRPATAGPIPQCIHSER